MLLIPTAWNIPSTRPESSSRHNGFSSKSVAVCALAAASALCEDCLETDACALLHANERQIGAEPSGAAHEWPHHGTMAPFSLIAACTIPCNHAPSIDRASDAPETTCAVHATVPWLGLVRDTSISLSACALNTTHRGTPNESAAAAADCWCGERERVV